MTKNDKKPSIRFKGFTDSWEQCKLAEICNVFTGGEAPDDHIKSNTPDETYKYPILSNGIGDNAIWGFSKEFRFKEKAITFSSIGTIGEPEIRNGCFTPIIRLKVIIPKDSNSNLNFFKETISKVKFTNNASGIPNINAQTIKNTLIYITSNNDEQNKIGALCDSIDNLITLHQRKLKTLKEFKKSMLNNMFI